MVEPGGLPSMGLHRVGHNWRDLAAAAVTSFLPPNSVTASFLSVTESLWWFTTYTGTTNFDYKFLPTFDH